MYVSCGGYGIILKFTYVTKNTNNIFVIKFSMIYDKKDINNPEYSTNVEHIMYGVL
jgi:hypothetical protein